MPSAEISTVVENILEAFKNGLDLFKRLRSKKKSRLSKDVQLDQEESRVHDSLLRRPQEIREEYSRHVTKFGHRFEAGDNVAHNSLGHVLLVLNTGLMNLINHALRGDSRAKAASRQSLYGLSEMAAVDTLSALSQLYVRLNTPRPSLMTLQSHRRMPKEDQQEETKHRSSSPKQDRRPPSPLHERGGWVRTKSGSSSTVSVVTPRKKSRTRPEKHQRSYSAPIVPRTDEIVSDIPLAPQTTNISTSCNCQHHSPPPRDMAPENRTHHQRPRRQPSMVIMPTSVSDSIHEDIPTIQTPPSRPPKIPLHSRPKLPIFPDETDSFLDSASTTATIDTSSDYLGGIRFSRKPRPASLATFMTASTKIGEIPEHKWPDRNLSKEEQQVRPLPYVIPPPLVEEKIKKRKGFKFWKKDVRPEVVVEVT